MSLYTIVIATECNNDNNMNSKYSKYTMTVAGKPVINWVLEAFQNLNSDKVIISTDEKSRQIKDCIDSSYTLIGTSVSSAAGDVIALGLKEIACNNGTVLIVRGDNPLIDADSLLSAYGMHSDGKNPATYMSKDKICDTYAAFFDLKTLQSFINTLDEEELKCNLSSFLDKFSQGKNDITLCRTDSSQYVHISDRQSLAEADKLLNRRVVEKVMSSGVTVLNPDSVRISPDVKIGRDTIIYPGTILEGHVSIGEDCIIGPNTKITDSTIGDNTEVQSSVVIESEIGNNTSVGPFAYVRPNSKIGSNIKVGDFVEVKNATIGDGTKIAHLTYVGDADVGERVNFGCGTVVVNYDGIHKHRTTIEDDCFIGCNTNLVSPVTVRKGAYTAAGSTITDEVPADALAIARSRQIVKDGWAKGKKK